MSLVVEWRHFSTGDVFDITDRINLTDGAFSVTENAEELTVGASTLVIDDPDGDFDIPGHSYIRVTETECPDEHVIWAGFVTIRHIKRATGFLTGAQRTWTGNLDDVNTVQARRILSETNDADRPAETDVERMQWLGAEGFIGTGFGFSTANPVDMDASNLVGMGVYDAINDCMLQSGKNCFQQDISDGMGGYTNFTYYDFAGSDALSSELQISNYISDITAEVGTPSPSGAAQTWYASLDTDMERDPTRIYWKIRGQYDGGTVTRTRPLTAVEFAARETTASWPLVKTAGAANARADRQLLDISTEEDVITTTIWVHPEHVNDARAGRRIQARFSHLPGYEDWTWMRILNRTVTFETPEVYRIQYTLSPNGPANPSGTCATAIVAAEAFDSGTIDIGVHDWSIGPLSQVVTLTPAAPSTIMAVIGAAEHSSAPVGFTTDSPYQETTATASDLGRGGYLCNVTDGVTFEASFTGGDVHLQCTVAAAFPTAATAPVQQGAQIGSGSQITLGAAPTAGNILICGAYALGGFSPITGWNVIVQDDSMPGIDGIHGVSVVIVARCVGEGESATVDVPTSSRYHSSFLIEVEP